MNLIEMYDIRRDVWKDLPLCLYKRCEHSSIVISTDSLIESVYLLGGKESSKKTYTDAFNKIEVYDLKGKTKWDEVALIDGLSAFSQ